MKPNNVIPFRSLQLKQKALFVESLSKQADSPPLTRVEERSLLRALRSNLRSIADIASDHDDPIFGRGLETYAILAQRNLKKILISKGVAHV